MLQLLLELQLLIEVQLFLRLAEAHQGQAVQLEAAAEAQVEAVVVDVQVVEEDKLLNRSFNI